MDKAQAVMENGVKLLEMAADTSETGRRNLVHAVSDFFLAEEGQLNDREEVILYEILRQIIHELETPLRQAISLRLADNAAVPTDLIMDLANDRIEVAYPILIKSPVLSEEHLSMVIRGESRPHRVAVATRHDLTEALCDMLISRGEEDVMVKLAKNHHARISSQSMKTLVDHSRDMAPLRVPLVRREDLPPGLALEMFAWISAALRQYIMERSDIDPVVLDRVLEEAVLDDVQAIDRGGRGAEPLGPRATAEERIANSLNEATMSQFLTQLHGAVNLDYGLMLRALFDPSGKGLVVVCRANGIGKSLFASMFGYIQKVREQKQGDHLRASLNAAIRLFDRVSEEGAREVVDAWKTRADFFTALNDLKLA